MCVILGPPQQYSGQEDYYGEQYSHGGQGTPEGINQQYYPDGNYVHYIYVYISVHCSVALKT